MVKITSLYTSYSITLQQNGTYSPIQVPLQSALIEKLLVRVHRFINLLEDTGIDHRIAEVKYFSSTLDTRRKVLTH